MPRLLALEWDQREARIVVGNPRAGRLIVEQAFTVPLSADDANTASIGAAIRAKLDERRVGKLECLVAVGRTNIELKYLALPPAPNDELPDLVRFQAMRDFNTLGDDWALDFIPLDDQTDQPRKVLAAAISPRLAAQISATCEAAGLEAKRLTLRPCAAASLLFRLPSAEQNSVRLLVDPLGEEVDLTVISGQTVIYLRTARLSTEPTGADPWKPLVNEIRRTLAAANNQLGAQRVEAIYFCGNAQQHAALVQQITADLQLPAHVFDPFSQVDRAGELKGAEPAQPGQFAPLLGMLRDEADETPPILDFFNPRRKPVAKRNYGRMIVAAASVLAVATIVALGVWWQIADLDSELATLTKKSKDLEPALKKAAEVEAKAAEIDAWAAPDLVWLDELDDLSKRFPKAQDALLTSLIATSAPEGSKVQLEGLVNAASTIEPLETGLRDERHTVEGKGSQQEDKKGRYSWKFKTGVSITPPEKDAKPKEPADNKSSAAKPDAAKSGAAKSDAKAEPAKDPANGKAGG